MLKTELYSENHRSKAYFLFLADTRTPASGGAGPEYTTPATADAPIPTTLLRSYARAVETPDTPATPELKRAKRAPEEIHWELVATEGSRAGRHVEGEGCHKRAIEWY